MHSDACVPYMHRADVRITWSGSYTNHPNHVVTGLTWSLELGKQNTPRA